MAEPESTSSDPGTDTPSRPTSGRVRLVNAVFYGHHGVMQEEHKVGGRYEVDVGVDLDFDVQSGRVGPEDEHGVPDRIADGDVARRSGVVRFDRCPGFEPVGHWLYAVAPV